MMGIDIQKMKDYLDSEEGKKSMDEWVNKMEAKDNSFETRIERVAEYVKNHSLDKVMDRMLKDNGPEWEDRCYKKGYEPYPTHLLSLVIGYANKYGVEPEEETWEDFLSSEVILENYKFQVFCGQGCFDRIYKKEGDEWVFFLQN